MTNFVGVREAKAKLSELLHRAAGGEAITITRNGKPVAKLVPMTEWSTRVPGRLRGRIRMAPDFDETPQEVIDAFEGRT